MTRELHSKGTRLVSTANRAWPEIGSNLELRSPSPRPSPPGEGDTSDGPSGGNDRCCRLPSIERLLTFDTRQLSWISTFAAAHSFCSSSTIWRELKSQKSWPSFFS